MEEKGEPSQKIDQEEEKRREIDLNTLFPEKGYDLNRLFPDSRDKEAHLRTEAKQAGYRSFYKKSSC